MIISPWHTTVLRRYPVDVIVSELAIAKATGGLVKDSPSVMVVTPMAEKVPAFILPITPEEYSGRKLDESGAVVLDGRSYMRRDNRIDSGVAVVNQMQADFCNRMGELTCLWIKEPSLRHDFLRAGDIAPQVYINWISSAISNKLGLEMDVARELQVITGVFYIHHFFNGEDATSSEGKSRTVKLIQRWSRHPVDIITSIVESLPYMVTLEDYVASVKEHFSHNTRVSQINAGFLVMALGNSWFGHGAREISAVALEYPPVYMALVEAACNAKVWKKTHLGKIVDRMNTGRAAEGFAKSMEILAGVARGAGH